MVAIGHVAVSVSDAVKPLTINVRVGGLRRFKVRVWMAERLFRLAAWVAGTQVKITVGTDFDELPPLPERHSYMMVGNMEVPKQASMREKSPLYVSNCHDWSLKCDFYINGQKRDEVISYDVDAGYMRVLKLGPDGQPFIAGDELATEILQGRVEILPAA